MQRTRQKSFKLALNISYRFLIDPTIIQNYLALMDSCRFPFCWWKALPQPFAHCPAYRVQEAQLPKEWMILLCSSHSDRKVSLSMKSMNYYSDLIQQDAPQTEVILIIQPHLIIIVMLSQLLKERKAHYDSLRMHISLSYLDQQLEIDELAPHYQQAKILSLTHCHLTSLEGLEQFTQLEELNLRSNKITEASELLRITNKQLITRLQFTGNDIEYLGAGMFFNLVQYFPNLVELNGKNYLSVLHKNPKKKHDMKRIVAQSYKLQKQMTKTVTRYKIHHPHDQATPSRTHKIDTNYQNQTESLSKNQDLQYTSKKQRSSIQYSPKPQQDKENYHNGSNYLQNDVSLGDISNIPLTKSVRGSYLSNTSNIKTANQNKKKGLEIVTLNESLQNNKVALSQPTATFAMQREKENQQSSFAFKNKEKKYLPTNLPIEENAMESKYDFERPTKRETYQSVSEDLQESDDSSNADNANLISQQKIITGMHKGRCVKIFYQIQMIQKVFFAWRNIPSSKNYPIKRRFN